MKRPLGPLPLYGLDQLAMEPNSPVLVCEGEKAAEAARVLFPHMVAITSLGGSKGTASADWAPLAGREVTIWPDHDDAGASYAADVTQRALAAGAVSVPVVSVPRDWPAVWDVADPLPSGLTPGVLDTLLAEAAPASPPVGLPPGFAFRSGGLWYVPATEKQPEPAPVFVAAQFEVVGEVRDASSGGWAVLLRWRDRDGHEHERPVPKRLVHEQANTIAAELEDAGLTCGVGRRAQDLLRRFIGEVRTSRRFRSVTRTGWHELEGRHAFVLPTREAFGPAADSIVLNAERASTDAAFGCAGTLADWQREVATYAVGNDRLAAFLCASFAGPLLDVMAEPSGGVHLLGQAQTGKSTATLVAGSVWGRGDRGAQVRAWRGTANGIEGVAAETSDAVLILHEIGQADAREVGEVVYMLANESGKARAGRSGQARGRQRWRSLFLSTGEVTLAAKMADAGQRTMAGLEVRLVNLPADAGAGLGAFQVLHGKTGPAELADHLRGARSYYGHAARAYVARLAQDRAHHPGRLRDLLAERRDAFLAWHLPAGAAGQVRSVASRFALIGAAGELARDYGVLPWPEGEPTRAAAACFSAWLAERGGIVAQEEAALACVQRFIELESRFTEINGCRRELCGNRLIGASPAW